MLVVSRKDGEQIRVGDDVYITIVSIQGGKVRVGVTAPKNRDILRKEVDSVEEQAHYPQEEKPKQKQKAA